MATPSKRTPDCVSNPQVPLELLNKNIQTGEVGGAREAVRRLLGSPGTFPLLSLSWLAIMLRDVPKGILHFTMVCPHSPPLAPAPSLLLKVFDRRGTWGVVRVRRRAD